ncbi:MAG: paraquat-inducible protein A [Gammaproteobacteria bacterium]
MDSKSLDSLMACHECDLLVERISLEPRQHAHCPRCNALLHVGRKDPILTTLIVSLSGLLLIYPAYFLPLMEMGALGLANDTSIIETVIPLLNASFWIPAVALLLFAIVFPVLILALGFWVSVHLYMQELPKYLIPMLRLFEWLIRWVMPEVYVIGIIVALVKLLDDFSVIVGTGLVSFCVMMFCSLLVTTTVSRNLFWRALQHAK